MRIDTYSEVLTFTQDLEASLLEIDAKEGEVYVGDLVGFESAIKSLASISEEHHAIHENSGIWSSLVNTLEQEERSSLLYSLTSLTSIKAIDKEATDDDEEDVTCISTIPQSVLGLRRIKSSHASGDVAALVDEKTHVSKTEIPQASDDSPREKTTPSTPAPQKPIDADTRTSQDKLAEIQNLESQIKTDDGDEDDAPTRVVQRPNYISIRVPSSEHDSDSLKKAAESSAIDGEAAPQISPLEAMKDRIAKATVIEHAGIIKPDVFYDTGEDPEEAIDTPSDESQNGDAQASDTPEMPQPRRTEQPKPRSTQPNALEEMTESARQLKAANDALRKKATLLKKAIVGILVFIVVVLLILIAFKKW